MAERYSSSCFLPKKRGFRYNEAVCEPYKSGPYKFHLLIPFFLLSKRSAGRGPTTRPCADFLRFLWGFRAVCGDPKGFFLRFLEPCEPKKLLQVADSLLELLFMGSKPKKNVKGMFGSMAPLGMRSFGVGFGVVGLSQAHTEGTGY